MAPGLRDCGSQDVASLQELSEGLCCKYYILYDDAGWRRVPIPSASRSAIEEFCGEDSLRTSVTPLEVSNLPLPDHRTASKPAKVLRAVRL